MRVKSKAAKSFWSFLRQVDKRLAYLVALLLLIGVPAVLLRGYFRTPAFLFSLKDALAQDRSIRQVIGDARGYSLSYSKQDLQPGDTAHFSVQVIGRCDSAYVLVKGWYSQKDQVLTYQVQDTVFVHNCQ
jgi:hypothetical protein